MENQIDFTVWDYTAEKVCAVLDKGIEDIKTSGISFVQSERAEDVIHLSSTSMLKWIGQHKDIPNPITPLFISILKKHPTVRHLVLSY